MVGQLFAQVFKLAIGQTFGLTVLDAGGEFASFNPIAAQIALIAEGNGIVVFPFIWLDFPRAHLEYFHATLAYAVIVLHLARHFA